MAIPTPEKRIAEFENFGFGIFIHWGLYSKLGKGEWIRHIEKIPKEEYEPLSESFTASRFDAKKIARLAKAAGAKYITLTSRHHEGFSLYDTMGLSDFDAPHSAAHRDLIREFVDACNGEGIRPFLYHTTLDWHEPHFESDFPTYLRYLRDSLKVLCTQYGRIGGFWFDGNWSKPEADWEEEALYSMIRRYQPDAILVNNTGIRHRGETGQFELDSVTFEQGRPEPMDREGMPKYLAAEMCHTMNRHWGFSAHDVHYESLPQLIETLCACRRVGANYLLNIGPDGEGEVPLMQEALLLGIGEWIRTTGCGIYTGKPCGVNGESNRKDFGLKTPEETYLYVHDLSISGDSNVTVEGGGAGKRVFRGVSFPVGSAEWTDNGEALSFTQEGDALTVNCTGFPYGTDLAVRVVKLTPAT